VGASKALKGTPAQDVGLIRPLKHRNDPALGPDAILVMIPSELAYLVKRCYAKRRSQSIAGFYELYQTPSNGTTSLTLAGPFLGAPQAVMGLEKIIALGAERIWILGWCGSITPDLKVGDLVIPTRALSDEGTSRHYPVGRRRPRTDNELNRMLTNTLAREGRGCQPGTLWTTDAPYRETPGKVLGFRRRGAIAVDMEMSALIRVAFYRGVRLAGILTVSDELFTLKWRAGFSDPRRKRSSRLAGRALLETIRTLGVPLPCNPKPRRDR
jgi:purine-nucleoside phosphorylase